MPVRSSPLAPQFRTRVEFEQIWRLLHAESRLGSIYPGRPLCLPSSMPQSDNELAELQSQIHTQMRGAFVTVIERSQKLGELDRSLDARELVASILGPLFYRRFFSREPLNDSFAKKVVARALRAIT